MGLITVVPLFTLSVFIIIIIQYAIRSNNSKEAKRMQKYFDDEKASNLIRKKEIDASLFFSPDTTKLPIKQYTEEETKKYSLLASRQKEVLKRSEKKMLQSTAGMSNQDIKFKFGTINLETIASYEENYAQYLYALIRWAEANIEAGYYDEAEQILQESIASGSQMSKSFTCLTDIYCIQKERKKIEKLLAQVENAEMPAKQKTIGYMKQKMETM